MSEFTTHRERLDEHLVALRRAIDISDFELASSTYRTLIVEHPDVYTTGTLQAEISRIPVSGLHAHPVLAFARAITELSTPSTQGAATEYLEIAASRILVGTKNLPPAHVSVLINIKVAALRLLGRFEESGAAARASLRYLDEHLPEEGDQSAVVGLRPLVFRDLAYSLFQAGDAATAHTLINRAVSSTQHPWSRNYALAHALGISAVLGQHHSAVETAALIDAEAWPPGQEVSYLNGLGKVGEATLRLDAFDYVGALAAYEGCESFLSTFEIWPFVAWTQAMASLGLGDFTVEAHRLQELLATTPGPPGIGANLGTAMLRGGLATLWLAAGRRGRALELVEAEGPCAGQLAPARALLDLTDRPHRLIRALPHLSEAPGHTVRSRMALLTTGAAAGLRGGNRGLATSLLDQASGLYQAHGARAHLMTVPTEDLSALRALALAQDKHAATSYLGSDDTFAAMPSRAPSPVLTEREALVLRTLADEPARKKLAAKLFVSENTVKTQVANIYRKLGVTSRDAALQRAVELELLDI
ncbi:MAG: helix-turn-helix domain-containing protein [Marmoricola sp.]